MDNQSVKFNVIDDLGICVCRDDDQGNKGNLLVFYKTREEALTDTNRQLEFWFPSFQDLYSWMTLNFGMIYQIAKHQ